MTDRTMLAETYTGSNGETYRVFRFGDDDASKIHLTYPTGYDSRCSMCWLGYSHSERAHRHGVNRFNR